MRLVLCRAFSAQKDYPTLFMVRPRAHDFAPLTVIINTIHQARMLSALG
jgi:hypothetical protein